jgi:hypothetical protein
MSAVSVVSRQKFTVVVRAVVLLKVREKRSKIVQDQF